MAYPESERRSTHDCIQTDNIAVLKQFMADNKSIRVAMFGVVTAIILQIATFGFLWGQLTTVVAQNTDFLWRELGPSVKENTRNIDRFLAKFEDVTVLSVETNKPGGTKWNS